MNINQLSHEQFKELPLVIEGESKEVRYAGGGEVVIRLKPTIYSYTHNRGGVIEGSDKARLQSIQALLPVLREAGIEHTYKQVNDSWILSKLVLQPEKAQEPAPFIPADLSAEEIEALPKAPPVEVVVKKVHSGTPKHRYYEFNEYRVRATHPLLANAEITNEQPYPETLVRFDWRNPLTNDKGERLADEVLPEPMAEWFIDVENSKQTAKLAFDALDRFLQKRQLELWDICFFIAEDGRTMFGEVSPDCLRVRAADGSALDKDVWRSGGSSSKVLEKWQAFSDLVKEAV
jgi:phosphoribosylaminoimidazole-succinocarboxamide synthase